MNLGSLKRAPEAGDFVELLLLYKRAIYKRRDMLHGIFQHVRAGKWRKNLLNPEA
jgi:hypothetical protein